MSSEQPRCQNWLLCNAQAWHCQISLDYSPVAGINMTLGHILTIMFWYCRLCDFICWASFYVICWSACIIYCSYQLLLKISLTSWVIRSYFLSQGVVISTSMTIYCFHKHLPGWWARLIYIIVFLKPCCDHLCQCSSRITLEWWFNGVKLRDS